MTTRPPVNSTAKWEIIQTLGDDLAVVNVLHVIYNDPAPLSNPNIAGLAAAMVAQWDAAVPPHQSHQLTVTEHVITDLHVATGAQIVVPDATAGSDVSTAVTGGAAMVIGERCLLRGRSFRGRIYLAGIGRSELAGGGTDPQHWDPAFVTAVGAAFHNLNVGLGSAAHASQLAVVSYFGTPTIKAGAIAPGNPKRNMSTPRPAPFSSAVTSFVVDPRVGSQRRRNA